MVNVRKNCIFLIKRQHLKNAVAQKNLFLCALLMIKHTPTNAHSIVREKSANNWKSNILENAKRKFMRNAPAFESMIQFVPPMARHIQHSTMSACSTVHRKTTANWQSNSKASAKRTTEETVELHKFNCRY